MKIQVRTEATGTHWVTLEGDLDFHSSPALRQELTKLTVSPSRRFFVDLKRVGYIDSSGLATFVELFQKLKRSGGKLILYNLSQGVRSVFEIAKLDTIFSVAKDEREALTLAP